MDFRATDRRRTLKSGKILFNLNRCAMDVRILNMSDGGLKVSLHHVWPCPPLFKLEITNPNTNSPVIRDCALVWQRGLELGVRYRDNA